MSTLSQHTPSGAITWDEDDVSGRGYLTLTYHDGSYQQYQWDEPIAAHTDGEYIASLFTHYDWSNIDHEGDVIHVS